MGIVNMKTEKILFLAIILLPFLLSAQINTSENEDKGLPVLNNHYFVPSLAFPSPFITTYFKTGIGSGTSLTEIPISILDGELSGTINAEDTFVFASIDVQVKVKDWMTAWFRTGMSARIGTSTPTILAHGFATGSDFEFGWLLRLLHNNKNQFAATISIVNTTVTSSNLLIYIKEIIDSPDSSDVTLSKMKNPLAGVAGLRYAYAFNDLWGIQAFFKVLYGEAILKNESNILKFDTGILASFEFSRYDVPVGVNFGYAVRKFDLFVNDQEDVTKNIFFELVYTHNRHFNMGLNFSHINTQTPLLVNISSLQFLSTTFVLNYFF